MGGTLRENGIKFEKLGCQGVKSEKGREWLGTAMEGTTKRHQMLKDSPGRRDPDVWKERDDRKRCQNEVEPSGAQRRESENERRRPGTTKYLTATRESREIWSVRQS